MRARVRQSRGLEPFPARGVFKRALDHLMYAVGIFAPVALLPQIFQIYSMKSGAGLSLLTWILVASVNLLWALYGAAHRDRQILFANILMASFDLVIIFGILLYS